MLEQRWKLHPMTWLLVAVILRGINQLVIKLIALRSAEDILDYVLIVLVVASVALLFLRAVCWQKALSHYPLTFAYPFFGLTMISLLFFGHFLFEEEIHTNQLMGVVLVFSGICLISSGYRNGTAHG
jgi:drug/metabolite transporter (DMT)-like permease